MSYLSHISEGIRTTLRGLRLSIRYFFEARLSRKKAWIAEDAYFHGAKGTFTVQYPKEQIPVPDHGRYQLHNEIDDCIVCDKCAKICPVDCIDIEPVRATGVYGYASNGAPLRIHAAKFDIDMAKCCFCGLCTVVCPTECLTMTKTHDFSVTDIVDHRFSFSKMTEQEIEQKKAEFAAFQSQNASTHLDASAKDASPHKARKTAKPVFTPVPFPKIK